MDVASSKNLTNFDTMNTGFETLLQAARYIEWQEQQNLSPLPTSPSLSSLNGRNVHSPLYNNNNSTNINNNTNNNNNNNSSSSRNNLRHHNNHQVSSPPISPVISTTANHTATTNGGIIGIVGLGAATALASVTNSNSSHNIGTINSHDYHEYDTSSLSVALARANDGRNEEPYTNGHSLSPSYLLISANNNTSTTTSTTTTSNQPNQNHSCDSHMSDIQMERDNNNSTNYLTKQSVIINNNTINYSPAPISNSWTSSSSSQLLLPSSSSSVSFTINKTNLNKKIYPLTPPPMPSRKLVEITRTRSSSLSSNKITANGGSGAATTTITTIPSIAGTTISTTGSVAIGLGTSSPTTLNGAIVLQNGNAHHNVLASATEDSSQSSLNLSSSGYLSGSSANSSIGGGGGSGSNHLNISNSSTSSLTSGLAGVTSSSILNGSSSDNHLVMQVATATGRRRTTSTNSNGGTQRSPCILRAGTREVHNKLEKHRRAHLKECFENLKIQLQLRDEEKKKTSNLAILGAAYRQVMTLKRKERELEQQVEQLAKDKINSQKKILSLKRELAAKYDNIDFANVMSDGDIGIIPGERVTDGLSDTLSSGRGSTRYSSSSSLSSAATMSSPSGSSGGVLQTAMPTTMSPVIPSLMPSHLISPNSPHLKSVSPVGNSIPLSLTVKNLTALTRCSPTPSIPSPSSSGISSSSPIVSSSSSPSSTSSLSSSPPMSWHSPSASLKIPNVPNGVKVPPIISSSSPPSSSSSSSNLSIVSSTTNCSSASSSPVINFTTCENSILSPTLLTTSNSGLPINLNAGSHSVQILHTQKDMSGKNGVCRKSSEMHDSSTLHHHQQSAGMILTSNSSMATKDKMFDESEQPTKVIKLVNGIALAPMDKDNKLLSSTPLALSQVVGSSGLVVSPFQMFTTTTQGLRVLGANGLATIELSTPTVQSQSRNHLQSSPTSTVTPTTGAQLHKLLVSGTTTVTSSGLSTNSSPATSVASELARLPGGAEVNILPAGVMPRNGKLAIVNNGITLKGNNGRAVHVVTPLQSGGTPISTLTPIVVSQGQAGNNLAHLIASSSQLAGKVNLSVGGQALPLISTQYLSSMKPMVVAVANNTTPTLSSVPPTATSVAIATVTANGSVS